MKKMIFTVVFTFIGFCGSVVMSQATTLFKGIVLTTSCGTEFTIPSDHIESMGELIDLAQQIDELDCGGK